MFFNPGSSDELCLCLRYSFIEKDRHLGQACKSNNIVQDKCLQENSNAQDSKQFFWLSIWLNMRERRLILHLFDIYFTLKLLLAIWLSQNNKLQSYQKSKQTNIPLTTPSSPHHSPEPISANSFPPSQPHTSNHPTTIPLPATRSTIPSSPPSQYQHPNPQTQTQKIKNQKIKKSNWHKKESNLHLPHDPKI